MARRRGNIQGDNATPLSVASIDDLLSPLNIQSNVEPLGSLSPLPARSEWVEIEDRRVFDPSGDFRSADDFGGIPAPARRIPRADRRWASVGFDRPREVLVCARRKERREVLFAKGKRGGRGGRRRHNWWSKIRC